MRKSVIVAIACTWAAVTLASDRTIGELGLGESVELRFKSKGCFHSTDVRIAITMTERFEVEVVGRERDIPTQVELAAEDIAQLDALLSYYRGLKEPGACTTEDTISFLWRFPTFKPVIEPFTDATCDAPGLGRALIHRLAELAGKPVAEPSNTPTKLSDLHVTPLAAQGPRHTARSLSIRSAGRSE